MKWVNMTDVLFCRLNDHLFMINRERRMGSYDWSVFKDKTIVFEGTAPNIGAAKTICKELFKKIKDEDKNIYVKANGKLTRRRYTRSKSV